MSWSVSAIGKVDKVHESIVDQFSKNKCAEPEETIRQATAGLINSALAAIDGSFAVKVIASGSQGFKDYTAKTGVYNQLSISVEPLHGFVE